MGIKLSFLFCFLLLGCIEGGNIICDDSNPCTHDSISSGRCVHRELSGPVDGCFGRGGCMEFACYGGECIPQKIGFCCGDGECQENEDYLSCPKDCSPTCFDGLKNQGESGIDCGGPCKSCEDTTLLYLDFLSRIHNDWQDSGRRYSESISIYNSNGLIDPLSSAALNSYGETEALRNALMASNPPEGMEDLRMNLKSSFDIYLRAMNAMLNFIQSTQDVDRLLSNKLLADSLDGEKDFILLYNDAINLINDQRIMCANYLWDEGEESVDCGGFCKLECETSYNVTKYVVVKSMGDVSTLTLNISSPAIHYPPTQRVTATYANPKPDEVFKDSIGNLFFIYHFDMPGYGVREFEITQNLVFYRANTPSKAVSDYFDMSYLQPNELSVLDDDICLKAEQICGDANSTLDKVRSIYSWMTSNLEYEPNTETYGAKYIFDKRMGACDEHADLFVSFTRCVGIPSRRVTGSHYNNSVLSGHAWAEYYDDGWVYIDPGIKNIKAGFVPDNRHMISCVGEAAYSCGVEYSFTYLRDKPNIEVKEKTYIS